MVCRKNVQASISALMSELCQMLYRPRGVAVVAVLTLLGGDCLLFYAIVLAALGSMGHAGTYTDPYATLRFQIVVCPPFILSFLSVIAAVGVFMRSQATHKR
jgi:putative effector of murein hydrolase LrgA (UPF0299 family)